MAKRKPAKKPTEKSSAAKLKAAPAVKPPEPAEQSQAETIKELAKVLGTPVVLQADVRILREGISELHKYLPPSLKKVCVDILLRYSKAIGIYCQCPEKAHIRKENKFACLDCGHRHKNKEGDAVKPV